MGTLMFSLYKLGDLVLITGVRRQYDDLFHEILAEDQQLDRHPISVQNVALTTSGRRTRAILLSPGEYQVYVQQDDFVFNGRELQTGKSKYQSHLV